VHGVHTARRQRQPCILDNTDSRTRQILSAAIQCQLGPAPPEQTVGNMKPLFASTARYRAIRILTQSCAPVASHSPFRPGRSRWAARSGSARRQHHSRSDARSHRHAHQSRRRAHEIPAHRPHATAEPRDPLSQLVLQDFDLTRGSIRRHPLRDKNSCDAVGPGGMPFGMPPIKASAKEFSNLTAKC
jgi:hypothetical protein